MLSSTARPGVVSLISRILLCWKQRAFNYISAKPYVDGAFISSAEREQGSGGKVMQLGKRNERQWPLMSNALSARTIR
jgi:hypothetical protein